MKRADGGYRGLGLTSDGALLVAVGGFAFAYTTLYWPQIMTGYDEGLFLYEARRIVEGDVPYRDFFELVTPAAWYILALAFRLFGVTMQVARAVNGLVFAGLAGGIFIACRQLRCAPLLAAAAALTTITFGWPGLPFASPHWFGTLSVLLVLVAILRRPDASAPRADAIRWAVVGVCLGISVLVGQQRGAVAGAGVGVVAILEAVFTPGTARARVGLAVRSLLCVGAGFVVTALPVMALIVHLAGREFVYDALVGQLAYYRNYIATHDWGGGAHWGYLDTLNRQYYHPRILRGLPWSSLVLLVASCFPWLPAAVRVRRLDLVSVGVMGTALWVSVLYNGDYAHLSTIAPFETIAVALIWTTVIEVSWLRRASRTLGTALGLLLCIVQLVTIRPYRTAFLAQLGPDRGPGFSPFFGRLDRAGPLLPITVALIQTELHAAGTPYVYAHPTDPWFYLWSGAKNPTRFQFLVTDYSRPAHYDEVIRDLEAKRVVYVHRTWPFGTDPERDPVWKYIGANYTQKLLMLPCIEAASGAFTILKRSTPFADGTPPPP